MNQLLSYFEPFPRSAKNGIIALFAAWIFFIFSLHWYYLPGQNVSRILIIAAATCFVVVRGYNWGRILCLLANVMISLWCVVFAAAFWGVDTGKFVVSVVNVILFSAATYYLWTKTSSAFFKTFRSSPENTAS